MAILCHVVSAPKKVKNVRMKLSILNIFFHNKEEGDEEVRETPRTPTIQRRMTPRIIPRRKMSFPAVSISAPQLKQQASQKMFLSHLSLRARVGRAHMQEFLQRRQLRAMSPLLYILTSMWVLRTANAG